MISSFRQRLSGCGLFGRRISYWVAVSFLLMFGGVWSCSGQISTNAIGNELTQVRITVTRRVKEVSANIVEENAERNNAEKSNEEIKTLPIADVPLLEAGDVLNIRFCRKCPGRNFADLGYKKLLIFFINPASVDNDLKSIDSVGREVYQGDKPADKAANGTGAEDSKQSKAVAELKFDGDLKSKKNQQEIYWEHQFLVPYKSIPLIFMVSGGDYKNELRKTILEKQADILKLSEQANLISQLPQAINFLLDVKAALQSPSINNPDFAAGFVQRAQFFRFNQTNCFQNNYLYRTDQARLDCLVKNINPDEITKDVQGFSLEHFGQIAGSQAADQLRSRYQSLNIFFDAAAAAINIISRLFQKKPLNIQLATLQSLDVINSASANQPVMGSQIPVNQSGQPNQASVSSQTNIKPPKTGLLSLRQMAVNAPINYEKALIIAPLKWKEQEEIIKPEDLAAVDAYPACNCLHQGKNIFWLDTDNQLIKQELKTVSLVLVKKGNDSPNENLSFTNLPLTPADLSLTLTLDDAAWKKIKDWREAELTISAEHGFDRVTKTLDLKVPAAPNWQLLRNGNEAVVKGKDISLKITPNTRRRDCLDKILLVDEKKQSVQLSALGEYSAERNDIVDLNLNAKLLDKLQAGKISIEVYENSSDAPAGKMSFKLIEKQK